jgi:signal transduction histidine kinase
MKRAGWQVVAFAGALQLALAVALPPLYGALLRLPSSQTRAMQIGFFALVALVAVASAWLVLGDLDAVVAAAKRPEWIASAQRRALQLPLRIVAVLIACEAIGLFGIGVGLRIAHAAAPVVVGVLLCSAALTLLLPVPVFAYARVALQPLALSLGEERAPDRHGSLAPQLAYAIAAVAWAALVPAAVFGAAQLDRSTAADARARAQAGALRLAQAAADLDVGPATTLVTHTPLAGGSRALYRAPSGVLLPEDSAAEIDAHFREDSYVEVPLSGAIRGGALRIYYVARPLARAPLLVVTLAMLLVALGLARLVGRAVARDLRGLTVQIDRVARDQEPGTLRQIATAEVRRLARSVNRLLDRVPRFTIESFLAIERAEEAQRLKSQFLANMSHDLRSPLNSILGFSELLLRGIEGEITPRQRRQLTVVQERGNQLLRLLNEILDTAKLESGRMELHRQSSPPAELVRAALQEARRGRPPSGADQVHIELQPGMQMLHADPLRITQAVTHLLNWGIDTGSDPVALTAFEEERPRPAPLPPARTFVVELEVEQDLDDDEARHLFDGFRGGGGPGGLHLALPLARRLAELHAGALVLMSSQPARLRLTIPISLPVQIGSFRT